MPRATESSKSKKKKNLSFSNRKQDSGYSYRTAHWLHVKKGKKEIDS